MKRLTALLGVALSLAWTSGALAQGPGASVNNAVGVWGVTSSGAPCLIAQQGASGAPTCALPSPSSAPPSATSTPPVAIQQTLTASAVQLAANPLTNGAIFCIPSTNTGTVYVGTVGVTTSTGYPLSVASGVACGSLGVSNTNLIYVIGTNTSDKLFVLGN